MNILFLGGAKRVSMARLFKKAAERIGEKAEIFSYEISTHVPIALEGKVYAGKKWSDSDVYEDIYRIVQKEGIRVIVPFVDGAIAVAAEMSARYPEEIFAPTVNPARAIELYDKALAAELFTKNQLPIPKTYTHGDEPKRLIAKPRLGSASKGLVNIDSEADLSRILTHADDYLIQERIDHREEFTVDCYVSLTRGRICAIVPRRRIEVSGGEVTHTETVFSPEVYDLARQTLESLALRGAVTIQILHDLDTDRYMLMEINPRLGGGAVCAVYAGVDLPRLILEDAKSIESEYQCYRPNTEIVRYQQEVAFYN